MYGATKQGGLHKGYSMCELNLLSLKAALVSFRYRKFQITDSDSLRHSQEKKQKNNTSSDLKMILTSAMKAINKFVLIMRHMDRHTAIHLS